MELERHLPHRPCGRATPSAAPSTSPAGASGRCGTSRTGSTAGRWRPTASRRRSGWGLVPPTVIRDGPLGEGSFQLFIEADFEQHYFTLYEQRPDLHPQLLAMGAFDVLANNTDRKSGHVLLGPDDRIWGVDQGLCFAADFKLRTVIWDFGGEALPPSLLADDRAAGHDRSRSTWPRCSTTTRPKPSSNGRASCCATPACPVDTTGRRYPWPMV